MDEAAVMEKRRQEHEPLLLWLLNSWPTVAPLLQQSAGRVDPKADTLLLDCRTHRGIHIRTLDHATIFAAARPVELTALRAVLSGHPFLYNSVWCKNFAKEIKIAAKRHAGACGPMFLFAIGDAPEHAPDQDHPLPDFTMKVAPFFMSDLLNLAEHNLGGKEQARVAQRKAAELEAKRQEIARRVEAARAAQQQEAAAAGAEAQRDAHEGVAKMEAQSTG